MTLFRHWLALNPVYDGEAEVDKNRFGDPAERNCALRAASGIRRDSQRPANKNGWLVESDFRAGSNISMHVNLKPRAVRGIGAGSARAVTRDSVVSARQRIDPVNLDEPESAKHAKQNVLAV